MRTNPQYIDRNHAGILIIWDRMFGSFEPEQEPCNYGLTTNINTFNPLRIAFHEWIAIGRDLRRARNWRERLGCGVWESGGDQTEASSHTLLMRRFAARANSESPAACKEIHHGGHGAHGALYFFRIPCGSVAPRLS